jgi:hypothetical protein
MTLAAASLPNDSDQLPLSGGLQVSAGFLLQPIGLDMVVIGLVAA